MVEDVGSHVLFRAEYVGTNSHGHIIIRHFVDGLVFDQLSEELDAELERRSPQRI